MNKNRIKTNFYYKDDKMVLSNANLINNFLNGELSGDIKFFPYFDFNLNMDLNGVNFTKFHSFFIKLNKKFKGNLFRINNKINGQLNISADKIYSKYNLINSFESRLKFINGDILIEQLLLNLGKMGAADIIGFIKNDKKFTNFKFENNIFIDNQKYFYSKFGIYNKKNISTNLFISGNLDLARLILRLDEISGNQKLAEEDLAYVEKEFNEVILSEDYKSFFNFLKFKEFIKLMMNETD